MFFVSSGCATSPPHPPREAAAKAAEVPLTPIAIPWAGEARAAVDAARRSAVSLGFKVTLSVSAGVFRANRMEIDRDATANLERDRLEALNGLLEKGLPGTPELLKPAVVHRRLTTMVTVTMTEVVVTPTVEVCVEGLETKCGPPQRTCLPEERNIVEQIGKAIRESAPPEPREMPLEPAQEV